MVQKSNETTTQKKVDAAVEKMQQELTSKKPTTKGATTKKEVKVDNSNKKAITEVVVHRKLKYLYPRGCKDTLSRKAFRQKVRNQLYKLERDIKDAKGEDKAKLKTQLETLKSEVIATS